MTIYAELLRFIDINRNCIFKVDLKKKSIRNGGSYFIKNGEYNPNKDLITLDCQFKTQKEATLYCLEVIENLYHDYKYSKDICRAVIMLDDWDGLSNWDNCEAESLKDAIDIIDGGFGILPLVG